jgi:hypothetical protein
MNIIRTRLTRTLAQHRLHAAYQRHVVHPTTRRSDARTQRLSIQAADHIPPLHLSVR